MGDCSGCGGTKTTQSPTGYRAMVSSNLMPDDDGFYHLYGEIEGEPLYTGAFSNRHVYVVGAGTSNQVIFKHDQRAEAIQYARTNGLTLDQYPTANLATSLMVAVYGS